MKLGLGIFGFSCQAQNDGEEILRFFNEEVRVAHWTVNEIVLFSTSAIFF